MADRAGTLVNGELKGIMDLSSGHQVGWQKETAMSRKLTALIVLIVVPSACGATAEDLLEKIGARRGICAVLGDKGCRLALALARNSELTLFVQVPDGADAEAACRAADAAGLYGTRIFVARGELSRISLADNTADAVVAAARPPGLAEAEVLRILRPEGKAVLGEKVLTKPFPAGTDDWSHHYHGPDNNPQSGDALARAPFLTQFIAEPRYGPCPQAAVASGGRLFMAFGHVAWHQREERWLNTLIAMNGFNGTILWKRLLASGVMVDRSTMISTPSTLYLADEKSCKLIDAATGKVTDQITVPADLTGGTFWKWMALKDGVLYALVGPAEPADPVARWRRRAHGWPWGGISKGYNAGQYRWGFGKTLLAIEAKTRKVLWSHREEEPIDSRSLCLAGGRVFFCAFGKYLAGLDAGSGSEVWRRTAGKDAELFAAIGPYRPGHGYVGGWKSTAYLKCTDKALYFVGPQVNWLTALSVKDGSLLWKYPKKDLHVVIRDDGLYTIGSQRSRGAETKKLDPLTGKVLASYTVQRRACTRSTGSADGIFFRASGGSVRLDLSAGKCQWIPPMRPSCHVGVVVAAGHLYWVPWVCDCNLQMFGAICCAPAGPFKFDARPTDAKRLETDPAGAAAAAGLKISPEDWPTYRADNRRSAKTAAAVAAKVALLWHFKPRTAFEPTAPVAAGGMVFVSGSDGIVRAFDAATGRTRWNAYTGGAVRYPPTIHQGRALVGSGDGWAYAFDAATGRTLWRFRAAPARRRIAVYGQLLSTWPVAGGVLVEKGTAYLAAGINSFDGTHVYALDAATGRIKWHNGASGHLDRFSGRGVGVQGDMLLVGQKLCLAGGNAVSPGVYDIETGKCLNRVPAGWASRAVRGRELQLVKGRVNVSGQPLYSTPDCPVYDRATRWADATVVTKNASLTCRRVEGAGKVSWELTAHSLADKRALWGQRLPSAPVRWPVAVDAAGRVVVTLRDGQVLCFGQKAAALARSETP